MRAQTLERALPRGRQPHPVGNGPRCSGPTSNLLCRVSAFGDAMKRVQKGVEMRNSGLSREANESQRENRHSAVTLTLESLPSGATSQLGAQQVLALAESLTAVERSERANWAPLGADFECPQLHAA